MNAWREALECAVATWIIQNRSDWVPIIEREDDNWYNVSIYAKCGSYLSEYFILKN